MIFTVTATFDLVDWINNGDKIRERIGPPAVNSLHSNPKNMFQRTLMWKFLSQEMAMSAELVLQVYGGQNIWVSGNE